MKVAILGAGAIGAYVGAALHRGGTEVHLIARGPHLRAMKVNGVCVESPRGSFVAKPPVTDDPRTIGVVDVIFLGVKAHSYSSIGDLLVPLTGPGTIVIAAQNGIPWWYFHGQPSLWQDRRIEAVDPDGTVSRVLPVDRAIGCVVYCSTELASPGVVRHVEGTRFSIGEPDGTQSKRCLQFSQEMVAGGLKCPVESDIRKDIWLKLMGNAAFNPLSVLTGATMGEIAGYMPTRSLAAAIMSEIRDVSIQLDAVPNISIERRLDGAARVGDHRTSMLVDFLAGKTLELDAILKAPIELGELVGVPMPSTRAVYASVALLESRAARRLPR